jgi:hypothetical protein
MINRGLSTGVDRFLGMLDKDSLFGGKSKEMFRIVQRHTPLIKHVCNGDSKAILSYALNHVGEILPKIPVTDMLGIALPKTLESIINKEQLNISNMYKLAVNQLNSMQRECSAQSFELIQTILKSPDKWTMFERNKHQLGTKICQILRPAIELERKFNDDYERLTSNPQAILSYRQIFDSLNVTYGSIQRQRNSIQRAIERESNGSTIMQKALIEFVDQLSQNSNTERKSSAATNALKEYLNNNIIQPTLENACEQEIDRNDRQLMDKFTRATMYIQEQFNRK